MNALNPRVAERLALALLCILFAGLAFVAPIAQPQDYHRFADSRALSLGPLSLPHAADVLTSLAFTAAGLAGLSCCSRSAPSQYLPLTVFFTGLVLTGIGSVWYHLSPSDASLVWDRLAMAMTFGGAVGAVGAERLGPAAGSRWLIAWLIVGVAAVALWVLSGDLRLYLVAQFGGLCTLLLWFRLPAAAAAVRLPWGWLLLAYGVAKGFELLDRQIWLLTDTLFSGHPIKHVVVALGILPMLRVLSARRVGAA
ncbi:hypothetical protein PA01_13735 [Azoarcus sp. PA01]|nr:hypothetical protein PA01_13735 [Azoarcus sp. PA01]